MTAGLLAAGGLEPLTSPRNAARRGAAFPALKPRLLPHHRLGVGGRDRGRRHGDRRRHAFSAVEQDLFRHLDRLWGRRSGR